PLIPASLYVALLATQAATPWPLVQLGLDMSGTQGHFSITPSSPSGTHGLYWITPAALATVFALALFGRRAEAPEDAGAERPAREHDASARRPPSWRAAPPAAPGGAGGGGGGAPAGF